MRWFQDDGTGFFEPTHTLIICGVVLAALALVPTLRGAFLLLVIVVDYVTANVSETTMCWAAGVTGWALLLALLWSARRQLRVLRVQRELRRSSGR